MQILNQLSRSNILIILLSMLVIITTALVGCGSGEGEDSQQTSEDGEADNHLTIGGPWFPERLDPVRDATMSQRLGILDTLVSVNYENELVPGLADEWDVSENGLTWTFTLREDVEFHDGTELNAKAVEKSIQRLKEEGTLFADVPIEDINAVDDYIIEITTSEYFAPLPSYMTKGETAPISKKSIDENGDFKDLIATGPYEFKEWEQDQQITIVKNENYWGEVAEVEEITYKGISEASTRNMMLRNNELDIAQILPADMAEELENYDDIEKYTEPIMRARTLTFNKNKELFQDLEIRRAISHAIDKEAIVEHIMAGIDKPANGPFPEVSEWASEDMEDYSYDVDKAEELLESAGFEKNDEGELIRDGEKLSIEIVTYPERAELPDIAEVLYSDLSQIGIDVNLNIVEYGQAEELRNQGEFDLYLMSRNLGFIPDPGLYFMDDYHSKNTEGSGYGAYGYKNEDLDELLEKANSSQDMEERREIYKQAQEVIVDDVPVIFLNHYVNVDAVSSNIQGYKMHPLENTFGLNYLSIE
ncbi:ABC transporter substrate-binding protein [Natranaerofaba carboxydovora]|uniref:ABC transporter substrate-binding protein n=1 Tax=Natranaerofaba carboxydovora TaxID=2742683 RepID=UPI001F12BE61|nr:ABC transporter substrate-binding protein [Natranaerofaba carboxydovora]UMZ72942.1 Periplasmic dipeptide transport protein [Natranaerofaba carboxydovora]